jgi:hypothetical protein
MKRRELLIDFNNMLRKSRQVPFVPHAAQKKLDGTVGAFLDIDYRIGIQFVSYLPILIW